MGTKQFVKEVNIRARDKCYILQYAFGKSEGEKMGSGQGGGGETSVDLVCSLCDIFFIWNPKKRE